MNKNKKVECKKSLIRNVEEFPSQAVVLKEPQGKEFAQKSPTKQTPESIFQKTEECPEKSKKNLKLRTRSFDNPNMYSTTTIVKKMEEVKNTQPRKIKSVSSLDNKSKLILEERITRKVNFPYDQAIYKNLIPLCVKNPPAPVLISRGPLPQKDVEPTLSDFLKPKPKKEYSFQVPPLQMPLSSHKNFNGFKLTGLMNNWAR